MGYKGNFPNVWDGVPQDVLDQYGLEYDKEWLDKFVDQSKRNITAEWDDDGQSINIKKAACSGFFINYLQFYFFAW